MESDGTASILSLPDLATLTSTASAGLYIVGR